MKCDKCGTNVQPGSRFCSSCGAPAEEIKSNACHACGTALKPEAQFCHHCGEAVGAEITEAPAGAGPRKASGSEAVSSASRTLSLAMIIGVPIFVGILFLLFYPRANPEPVSMNANASPQQDQFDMAQMEPVFKQIDSLKNAIQVNPQDTLALAQLATLFEMAGKYEQAAGYYRNIVEASPHNFQARMNLAGALFNNGQQDEAIEELQTVLRHLPNYDYAMYNLGVIYAAKDEQGEALKWWQKVIALDQSGELAHRAQEGINMLSQ